MYFERLGRALPEVRERIAGARRRAGRSEGDPVTILPVTKGHPLDALHAARDAGLAAIAESRVQEAQEKWAAAGDLGLSWHLVGHLQRNKVRKALEMFELVHSVDSLRLASAIDKQAGKAGRAAAILVQVNASGEEAKFGFAAEQALGPIAEISAMENLEVLGLMTMAPFTDDETLLRTTFGRTRRLFERCRDEVEGFDARHLSMGMTNDFEIAVEEGATMVRLGTVLFGERTQ